MILRGGILAQIQIAVQFHFIVSGIGADGFCEAFAERPVQGIAHGDVRIGDIQQRIPVGQPVIQHAAQGNHGDENQHQRKLIVFKNIIQLLREAHGGKSLPVFCPFRFGQSHSVFSPPDSPVSLSSSGAFGS